MVQKRIQLLTDRQREAIKSFIDNPPRRMTQAQRSLRFNLKEVDFAQLEMDLEEAKEDIRLMRLFNGVDVPMGRATDDKKQDLKAQLNIRRQNTSDTKAEFEVKKNAEN